MTFRIDLSTDVRGNREKQTQYYSSEERYRSKILLSIRKRRIGKLTRQVHLLVLSTLESQTDRKYSSDDLRKYEDFFKTYKETIHRLVQQESQIKMVQA